MRGRIASDESGLTLIELLVAISMSVVVLFALTSILTGTLRGTQRTFTRVDATRQGRDAIANLENEMHSACIGANQAPVQSGSTESMLQFVSYYGTAVTPTPVWHVITYSGGTLTDQSYSVTGSAPNWVQGSQTSSNQLLSNVTQNGIQPVFQYYAYQPGSSDSGGTYWFVQDGTTPDPGTGATPNSPLLTSPTAVLSSAQAASTVEVVINLSVGATSQSLNSPSLTTVNDQVDDAISLRLTTPPDEVSGTSTTAIPSGYSPCQ